MDFIASLFQQDMFLAVVSYLSVGLLFLAYFFYREKKWENELTQYRLHEVHAEEDHLKSRAAEIFVLNGYPGNALPPTLDAQHEMQVVDGESMEPESPPAAPPTADESGNVITLH